MGFFGPAVDNMEVDRVRGAVIRSGVRDWVSIPCLCRHDLRPSFLSRATECGSVITSAAVTARTDRAARDEGRRQLELRHNHRSEHAVGQVAHRRRDRCGGDNTCGRRASQRGDRAGDHREWNRRGCRLGTQRRRDQRGRRCQAAADQATSQLLARPVEPPADRPGCAAEPARGFLLRLSLQIAEHHRPTIFLGQPVDLLVKDATDLVLLDVVGVLRRLRPRDLTFLGPSPGGVCPNACRDPVGHAVKPRAQRVGISQRAGRATGRGTVA